MTKDGKAANNDHEEPAIAIKPPKPLIIDNDGTNWKEWLQQFNWYSVATQLKKKSKEVQAATFMAIIGPGAARIFNTFGLTTNQQEDIEEIKNAFEKYFTKKDSEMYERYKFNLLKQSEGQTFDQFLTEIKEQANRCNYDKLRDSLIRDKIVIGINSETVREKLLCETDLTLDKAIDICKHCEQSLKQLKVFQNQEHQVNLVKNNNKQKAMLTNNFENKTFHCKRCGTKHGPRNCPAYQKKCEKCSKLGHFSKMCRTNSVGFNRKNKTKTVKSKNRNVNILENNSESEVELYLNALTSLNSENNEKNSWTEVVKFGNKLIKFKLDSGAQCNVLSENLAHKIKAKIKPTLTRSLVSYSGHKISVMGDANIDCQIKNKRAKLNFKIIKEDYFPLLGKETCEKFCLLVRPNESYQIDAIDCDIFSGVNNIFEGLGCLKNFKYDIDLIREPEFEIMPPRRVPFSIKNQVKSELDKMLRVGIIEPMKKPTPIVSSMVLVRQKGKIRICLDPSNVNKNILRRHFPLKTLEEITSNIKHSKFFTLLDCSKGFWQIPVTEKTKQYLTFSTPWGRFAFTRLPFGLASAPEVFQEAISNLLSRIDNVECYIDDILIHAATEDGLSKITKKVINILHSNGLKLNKEKCIFNAKSVRFMGHVLSDKGLSPDPDKVLAIDKLEVPTTKKQLQRFLGMITYLSKFIPNMSQLTQPLRQLLHKDVPWVWEHEQQSSFERLRESLKRPPLLKYYDVNENVTLSVDASSHAIGAVLIQAQHPVAYATKSLTKAQLNYPQIEKEASAIRFACMKFHQYIYGKKLVIETDHKPLESIFKKKLQSAPLRLQRILFDVLPYSPKIIYKKSSEIPIADTLSRDIQPEDNINNNEEDLEVLVTLPISNTLVNKLKEAVENDSKLQILIQYILKGWPKNEKEIPVDIKHFKF